MEVKIVLVGRRNVGKSTLFNALTGTRNALVANFPGLTRDRQYGRCTLGTQSFQLVDTGGAHDPSDATEEGAQEQLSIALAEASIALLVVDARDGLSHADKDLSLRLRRSGVQWMLVINKIDGVDAEAARADFLSVGAPHYALISATHRNGLRQLGEQIDDLLSDKQGKTAASEEPVEEGIPLAIVGRPNTGKSTLMNRLLGEERVVVSAEAGVTRDSIHVPCRLYGTDYLLIDTAGMRRRRFLHGVVEKFSTHKTLDALHRAKLAVLMIDATESWVSQDATLLDTAMEAGCATMIAANKCDLLTKEQLRSLKERVEHGLRQNTHVPWMEVSATEGSGVKKMFQALAKMYAAANREIKTPRVNQILRAAIEAHPPPMRMGKRAMLRYAHNSGTLPVVIVIYGSRLRSLSADYKQYLMRAYRDELSLDGVPIHLVFRSKAPRDAEQQ